MSFKRFPARFGRYLLLDRINAGGMAEVYRAKVTGVEAFQRLLAIKTMLPTLTRNEAFVSMFVDEAKLAAQLNHPNIVQIHELGRIGDVLYIAMELVNGHDVGHLLRVARALGRRLPFTFVAYVMNRTAEALDFAHHKTDVAGRPLNLVHRDVSPQNILLSFDGDVKVADFGIAKTDVRASTTRGGVVKGKVPYMAPEQVTARALDRRTDIFALGAVMYEALTGEPLFAGSTQIEIMTRIRDVATPSVRTLAPELPAAVDDVLQRALAKKPDDRFQTAEALAAALSGFLIDGASLYGARQAAALMDELFHDEIRAAAEKSRRYDTLTAADCLDAEPAPQQTQLFQTAFQGQTTVLPVSQTEVVSMSTEIDDVPTHVSPAPSLWWRLKTRAMHLPLAARVFAGTLGVALALALVLRGPGDPPPVDDPAPASPLAESTPPPQPPEPAVATASAAAPTTTKAEPATTAVEPAPAPPVEPAPPASKPKAAAPPRPKEAAPVRYGYLSLRADGVIAAKIIVDGTDVGYSPVIGLRLPLGKHKIRIVEQADKGGRTKTLDVTLTGKHTSGDPLRLVIPI
ncbi:MAG: serine/threonine protein kinase [Deltaproteobacteria bacterium]|nr:serine/threonine protein kinase [Deltaproteobacteria bacterium]